MSTFQVGTGIRGWCGGMINYYNLNPQWNQDADPVFSTEDVEIVCAALSPHFERHILTVVKFLIFFHINSVVCEPMP